MAALEEFRAMIEEHWPHSNPSWRDGQMKFAPTIDAIADRIEEEYMELPKDADGKVIHVGDMVDLKYGSDKTVEVYGVNDHAVYTQYGCHGAGLVRLVKPKPETIDDVRNEITADWDYAHDLIDRAYECGKRDAE